MLAVVFFAVLQVLLALERIDQEEGLTYEVSSLLYLFLERKLGI